ncbi:dihydrolipoamide acetyltransferase [Streptococcus anginosus]|jgi:acetoin dehydrogenase complex, E2 component, dihydrolipoamide acetyltransferase, putative|uniref:Dihydrolipoamide acetyltransferase n=2 Tax=Streptococcus TaxID=1301 RepID=A0AAU7Q0R9_9STRE|nr:MULTISPECIES: dihydrolipoamide acetyltransferase [Streptococcus]MBC5618083.1 dihydrolipoamide acetyltransferase [Streptococcus hominis]MCW0924580.1 dihydrolipoamide acetyltransferase [Streptococcus anginosus]QOG24689.1 dihydrolipoamide acetyltransferase [Streptococcus sp. KS 6]
MIDDKLRATPAARKLADDLGINLYDVSGTGAKGRVHKEDIESYREFNIVKITPLAKRIAEENNIAWQEIQGTGIRGKIMKKDVLTLLPENVDSDSIKSPAQIEKAEEIPDNIIPYGEIERLPMTPMRKVIAKRMVDSYLTAPTFTLNYDVDMTELLALRKKVLEPIMEATGKKITVTDLLSMAVVKTLMKHPYLNSSLTEDGQTIIMHNYVNLAMAVGMDNGLMTPVVYNAEKMSLSELVVAFKDVIGRTLDGKLAPSELQNSTFTISNLGMFGVQSFGPIINQPNSAILGVSSTIEKPVVVNGEIVIRPIMSLGLTIDHRIVDGMAGAKFMKDLKTLIEDPISMLV